MSQFLLSEGHHEKHKTTNTLENFIYGSIELALRGFHKARPSFHNDVVCAKLLLQSLNPRYNIFFVH